MKLLPQPPLPLLITPPLLSSPRTDELTGMLGKGKFAVVHRAKHKFSGDVVAVKQVQIFDMMSVKARYKCLKEIQVGVLSITRK